MPVKYHIRLSNEEQQKLKQVVRAKKMARYKRTHAQILLALDENGPRLTESETAATCVTSIKTVQRVRKCCVEEGLETAVEGKIKRNGRSPILDGEQHAHLVALACSKPPEGACRWTMKLLANQMIELDIVDSISAPTVCRELKKTK